MDQETRHLFSQQLAHWARQTIAEGRSPFRRVDLDQPILSATGEHRPPLIFWVNRESFMAGGVVLLPDKDSPRAATVGRDCAEALGLRHFVTWTAREITVWEIRGEAILTNKTIPLDSSDPVSFQKALRQLMEELKPLSVMGTIPPAQLSAYYLANLWHSALQISTEPLAEEYRAAWGENLLEQEESPDVLAYHKGAMTLLRLLTLTCLDQLPSSVQPENLEVAMQFALDTLPDALRKPLQQGSWELPLPATTAVRFHHLFRRLVQLDIGSNHPRLALALELFIDSEARRIGAAFSDIPAVRPRKFTLLLNPARPVAAEHSGGMMEIGSPPLLALLALLRKTLDLPPAQQQANDVFSLVPATPPSLIQGSLGDGTTPSKNQRQAFATYLRTSWPSRRFVFDPKMPRWSWDLLHLLGLAAEHARIELETPSDWLTARYAEPLVSLLQEEFTLIRLSLMDNGRLTLLLSKDRRPEQTTVLESPMGERQLGWLELCEGHRSLLPLALKLDQATYSLVETERLTIPEAEDWPMGREREIFLFSRSSLGRLLWDIVSGGLPLPPLKNIEEQFRRQGLPLPGMVVFDNLGLLGWSEDKPLPSTSVLDEEIGRWLGKDVVIAETTPKPRSQTNRHPAGAPAAELMEQICAEVFADGLPRFPEQYLYHHYRPQLTSYRFAPPLLVNGEFFGRFTLQDADGQTIDVEGEETARALVLIAAAGRAEVDLPTDRRLTMAILEQYLRDLRILRQALVRQTHVRIANTGAAAHMTEKIWDKQPLPPWELINA
ncbi:MAG: hypothetical protein A2X84_04875 [Desulfuromonadaceae bacterium GWC2_58_13]|nr:MAG: hypothetical protein A2X84_04875 [Desulfuromonadaceae bacterium GWC2_58_13]